MTATMMTDGELAAVSTADAALLAVADEFTACGYSVRCPALHGSAFMQIANARAALCDLTITADGTVMWEYRTFDGSHVAPAQIAALALDLLDPDRHRARPTPAPQRSDISLKGAVGQVLTQSGMTVTLWLLDLDRDSFDAYAEIQVINPAQPARGAVYISDDGDLRWRCLTGRNRCGITLSDLAATIATALTQAQHGPNHA